MKHIYKVITILVIGLAVLSCEPPMNNSKKWDGSDNSSSSLLKEMPSVDLSSYDLSITSGTRTLSDSEVGDWSEGAGFAKGLRNKSIRFSRKSEYLADLIKLFDLAFKEFNLSEGTHYFKPDTFNLPFEGEGFEDAIIRVVVSGDRIAAEVSFKGDIMIQVFVDGGSDSDPSTQIVEVWQEFLYNGDDWEKQWIKVDNTNTDKVVINFEQTGRGSAEGSTKFDYNYQGYLEQNSEEDEAFNVAKGAFSEIFTGDENFGYQLRYSSKFNSQYGSTIAYQQHEPEGSNTFGPESWSLESNKIVDPETDTTYSSEIFALSVDELPSFDITPGLSVEMIQKDWATEWNGKLPEGETAIEILMSYIPEENLPKYEAWDKYEDLTTFTENKSDYSEEFSNID